MTAVASAQQQRIHHINESDDDEIPDMENIAKKANVPTKKVCCFPLSFFFASKHHIF